MKVKLPKNSVKSGDILNHIAQDLKLVANVTIIPDPDFVIFDIESQSSVEYILNHDAIVLIADNGGDVEGYVMYAELPAIVDNQSIYQIDVPEGLPSRTIKTTTGSGILEGVKKLKEWTDNHIKQSFSVDYSKLYILNNPLTEVMSAQHMNIFVKRYGARLLTIEEFKRLETITEQL